MLVAHAHQLVGAGLLAGVLGARSVYTLYKYRVRSRCAYSDGTVRNNQGIADKESSDDEEEVEGDPEENLPGWQRHSEFWMMSVRTQLLHSTERGRHAYFEVALVSWSFLR